MPCHPILLIYFLFVETLSINLRKNNISKNGNFPLFSLLTINCQKWANYRLQNGQMWFFYIGTIKSDLYQGIKVKINDMTSNNYCCLMVYCGGRQAEEKFFRAMDAKLRCWIMRSRLEQQTVKSSFEQFLQAYHNRL